MEGMINLRYTVVLTSRSLVQLVSTKLEKTLVKEIIADKMDSHGGYEKPQVQIPFLFRRKKLSKNSEKVIFFA
jgi:hypothetical protein